MSREALLILGASSDIGMAVIREMAKDDVKVFAHYRDSPNRLSSLGEQLGCEIVPIQADLANLDDTRRLLSTLESERRTPVGLVHLPSPPVEIAGFRSITWEDYQKHIHVQLRSLVMVLGSVLPEMARAGRGSIVTVLTSYTWGMPPRGLSPYVTAKYALLGLMKSLAAEYASAGININAVSPSMVDTRFLSGIPSFLVEAGAEEHPMRRNARPEDIAPLVRFLLSDDAQYISGGNFPVTGAGS